MKINRRIFFPVMALVLVFQLFWGSALEAYYIPISLQNLVARSEAIVAVSVIKNEFWKKTGYWLQEKNNVRVLKSFKGDVTEGHELEVVSERWDPALGNREDPPTPFPAAGTKALLFLKKNEEGNWRVTDWHGGIWGFHDTFVQHRSRMTLEKFEATVKSLMNSQNQR
jgi:hypothetical protein